MIIEENYETNYKIIYTEKILNFMYIYKNHTNILGQPKKELTGN